MPGKTGGTRIRVPLKHAAVTGHAATTKAPAPIGRKPTPTPKPTRPPRGHYPGPHAIEVVEIDEKPTVRVIKEEVRIVGCRVPDILTGKDLGRIGVNEKALSLPSLRRGPTRGGFPGPRKI